MANIISKIENLELTNGEKVGLTFNYGRMLYLRNNGYEKEINMAMAVINTEKVDLLEMPYYFYAAYLCANKDIKYTQDEFLELMPWDLQENTLLFERLTKKKKDDVSKMRSSANRKKAK